MSAVVRTVAAAVVLPALILGSLTACGADDEPVDAPVAAEPTETESTETPEETASPEPEPTRTPTARPLSRFEDEPAVKAMRSWAEAVAADVTANDRSIARSATFIDPALTDTVVGIFDQEFGLEYPGPLPFTPTRVAEGGGEASVETCLWTAGWGLDAQTGRPIEARKIAPARFTVMRSDGAWVITEIVQGTVDCSQVRVRGIA